MRSVTVDTLDDLDIVLNVTRKEFDSHGKLKVVVKQFEESLSDKQRGLYWRWVGVFCADTGDTKDDFHRQAKERIFLPIFLRDIENHLGLVQAANTMKSIRNQVSMEQYQEIRKYIIDNVSHLNATVKNMAEVLKQLESEAISLQIKLPPPTGPGLY